jgi:hypothetical protein
MTLELWYTRAYKAGTLSLGEEGASCEAFSDPPMGAVQPLLILASSADQLAGGRQVTASSPAHLDILSTLAFRGST